MGSRLLPLSLAVCAVLADSTGLHGIASYLVLLAIPCAAAAAFLGVGDALEGKDVLRAVTTCLALALLVLASAARANAAEGAAVPALAASAMIGAVVVYGLPLLAWLLEPLKPRPRARIRTNP
jgi:hypothetical protein